ncbi:MAG TPA: ATP-binding protein [Terracidiphilus sp.]|nr:ATP-binding protein [Terracidiphilus sp.]
MRLKTKLVLAITSLVFLISGLVSLVYVSQLLNAAVKQSYDANYAVANQARLVLQQALESGLGNQTVNPNDPQQLRDLVAATLRSSASLHSLLESVNRYSLTVYDINIADRNSLTLLSTNPTTQDKPIPVRPDYTQLLNANPLQLMREVFGPPRVYDVVVPLERNGQPFITVHVGARTTLLRAIYAPWLREALTLMGFALVTSLVVAFFLGNIALRPLEEISMQLAVWTPGEVEVSGPRTSPIQDTPQRVSTQIERIGQRMRSVEEVFSALKENLDQVLSNLQDGLLLFTGDGRAVLVSEAARRFLGVDRDRILGLHARDIFDRSTVLGRTLREAWDAGVLLLQEEVHTESGRRIQASLDFIHDDRSAQGLGALVTLHDLESVEKIESEIELSRRLAAIGRLTAGVGHEVKNPINAIVVHLELLRNKLGDKNHPAARHLEIIDAEIHRLDRVVQTLVDFSRPVDLQLREQDLRDVLGDVLALAAEELPMHSVTLESSLPDAPLVANVDADLLKQAFLNVIQNGAQAMPQGGALRVLLEDDKPFAVLRVIDEGVGIPDDIKEKIFDLYFTTRAEGSGIGLAMTYRILQLHHGSVDVQSEPGRGTEFRLRIPLSAADWGRRHPQQSAYSVSQPLNRPAALDHTADVNPLSITPRTSNPRTIDPRKGSAE